MPGADPADMPVTSLTSSLSSTRNPEIARNHEIALAKIEKFHARERSDRRVMPVHHRQSSYCLVDSTLNCFYLGEGSIAVTCTFVTENSSVLSPRFQCSVSSRGTGILPRRETIGEVMQGIGIISVAANQPKAYRTNISAHQQRTCIRCES